VGDKLVILGNGPSLLAHLERGDFDALAGIPTLGMNRIDLLYPLTSWRPTWYLLMEQMRPFPEPWATLLMEHIQPGVERVLLEGRFRRKVTEAINDTALLIGALAEVRWIHRATCDHYGQLWETHVPSEWHLPELCPFGGSISGALQLAFMLGYTDVGLIGCDLGIAESGDHFDPAYKSHVDGLFEEQDDTLRHAHRLASQAFGRAGRRVLNLGIGGALEEYLRMDLRRWLNES